MKPRSWARHTARKMCSENDCGGEAGVRGRARVASRLVLGPVQLRLTSTSSPGWSRIRILQLCNARSGGRWRSRFGNDLRPSGVWPPSWSRITSPPRICSLTFRSIIVGGRGVPVVAGDIPHDRFEAELAGDAQDCGPASAKGWTEKVGVFADGVLQSRAAVGEFCANFGCALENQQGMGEGVIADRRVRLWQFREQYRDAAARSVRSGKMLHAPRAWPGLPAGAACADRWGRRRR